eukprot:1197712-Rhodomonas_salina.1
MLLVHPQQYKSSQRKKDYNIVQQRTMPVSNTSTAACQPSFRIEPPRPTFAATTHNSVLKSEHEPSFRIEPPRTTFAPTFAVTMLNSGLNSEHSSVPDSQ